MNMTKDEFDWMKLKQGEFCQHVAGAAVFTTESLCGEVTWFKCCKCLQCITQVTLDDDGEPFKEENIVYYEDTV